MLRTVGHSINCCNELENPIGIETRKSQRAEKTALVSCNELENPIGIETW